LGVLWSRIYSGGNKNFFNSLLGCEGAPVGADRRLEIFPSACYKVGVMQVRAVIRGRVQGVCYRAWTQQTACSLGLKGWVCNRPDGSVELQAQGAAEPLRELLRLCRQGPPAAQVEAVEETWLEGESDFSDFSIARP
jgi:acylphosphatase